jgi:hypothetical protein
MLRSGAPGATAKATDGKTMTVSTTNRLVFGGQRSAVDAAEEVGWHLFRKVKVAESFAT